MATNNKNITFKGNKLNVIGTPVQVGGKLPSFKLTGADLADLTNSSFSGKPLIVISVPSVDTPTCDTELKRFSKELPANAAILAVSVDLPFAQKRWCAANGVSNITVASDYKYRSFGEDFGTYIQELGLLTRAVFVADSGGTVLHVEYVDELGKEPDYASALASVGKLT